MTWRILKYIQHQFYLRHRKGHGIHSPYLFEFVHEVVFNEGGIRVPGEITREHGKLLRDRTLIPAGTLGEASVADRAGERTVGSFIRNSSVSEKFGALLHRITHWFNPDMIIELGTGLGISTVYLGSGCTEATLHTLEGNRDRAAYAAELVCRCGLEQVSIHRGDLDQGLEELLAKIEGSAGFTGRFVAFMDANHRYEPTVQYARSLLEKAGEEAIIILDDIYWSKDMYRAWREITAWQEVDLSIDLFHMGILLLRSGLNKASVKINF